MHFFLVWKRLQMFLHFLYFAIFLLTLCVNARCASAEVRHVRLYQIQPSVLSHSRVVVLLMQMDWGEAGKEASSVRNTDAAEPTTRSRIIVIYDVENMDSIQIQLAWA